MDDAVGRNTGAHDQGAGPQRATEVVHLGTRFYVLGRHFTDHGKNGAVAWNRSFDHVGKDSNDLIVKGEVADLS